jgi:hypothetical protein
MSRGSHQKNHLSGSFQRIFAANSALFIGMAFDLGMVLGRRAGTTLLGRKVRSGVSDLADRVVTLAPSAVSNLVPDLLPTKPKAPRRKPSGKKRAAE